MKTHAVKTQVAQREQVRGSIMKFIRHRERTLMRKNSKIQGCKIGLHSSDTSTGYDEISIRTLRYSLPYIISPLTHICNAILNHGLFPDRLKYATVIPIHKKGDSQKINNYRPISLLTLFSKVFEKIIYVRLYKHLTLNSILTPNQF